MEPIRVGLVADPAFPTEVARRVGDLEPPGGGAGPQWDVELRSEPFTSGSGSAAEALERLAECGREHGWDVVVGLTELPLRDEDDERYLLVEADRSRRLGVLSLPALGGVRPLRRTRAALVDLVAGLADPDPSLDSACPCRGSGGAPGSCAGW